MREEQRLPLLDCVLGLRQQDCLRKEKEKKNFKVNQDKELCPNEDQVGKDNGHKSSYYDRDSKSDHKRKN